MADAGGFVFHVLNRASRRERLFATEGDYLAFEELLGDAVWRIPTRLLSYCVMPNHWHLVLWPQGDEIPRFMHWLTLTHAKRWHRTHGSDGLGPVYQNRYKAIPVQRDDHLLRVIRYVERNALRAGLVSAAEQWRWCSLWHRRNSRHEFPLAPWPILQPANWAQLVNEPHTRAELESIQSAVRRSRPLGDENWSATAAAQLGLRLGEPGRPRTKSAL